MRIPGITEGFKTDEDLLSRIAALEDADKSAVYSKYTFAPTFITPSVTVMCGKTKKQFKYNPQKDLTTLELAYLMQLLVVVASLRGPGAAIDVDSYVTEYKLERHFQIT